MEKIKGDVFLDARGKYCPEPITMSAKKMRTEVQPGQILEVWAEDDAAIKDFTSWCQVTGHELLGFLEDTSIEVRLSGADIVRRFFIRKKK
jgi:TusA-related sulfurtransferase